MNYQDKFIHVIVTVTMIVFCSTLLAADHGKRMAWGERGVWRTWTVFDFVPEDDKPHFKKCDQFRIADVNDRKLFVPRSEALLARLNQQRLREELKIPPDEEFFLPLETPGLTEDPNQDQAFCTKIDFNSHKGPEFERHYMQIIHNSSDILDIKFEPYVEGIEAECGKIPIHGGMAHAND